MIELEILGLDNSYSYQELKTAYRKKSIELHPDKNKNREDSHQEMIRLNLAYSYLLKLLEDRPITEKTEKQKDHSYIIYKKGIERFKCIHPSRWKTVKIGGLFDPGEVATHSETPEILNEMLKDLADAYHYFSVIINKYRDCPWYADSLSKVELIEKLTDRYVRIKQSYEKDTGC